MRTRPLLAILLSLAALQAAIAADDFAVGITRDLAQVEVLHQGRKVAIMRNQDQDNLIDSNFARTSRPCPPFCIQPGSLGPGVVTIGELEVLDYLQRMGKGGKDTLVIDSRTPDWVARGTIPGAVNIPWTRLNPASGADPISISEILEDTFGARSQEGLWDFTQAKTLVFFCNGAWCGQSPQNVLTLLKFGYPAHKIKWYRGGMQAWQVLGLTTVKP